MTLNAGLSAALKLIVDGTRSATGHAFALPKSPAIKHLEKEGFVQSDPAVTNSANGAEIAYRATDKGFAEFPAPPTPVSDQDAPAVADPGAAVGGAGAAEAATAAAVAATGRGAPRGRRAPRPEAVIQRSGKRIAALPVSVRAASGAAGAPRDKYGFGELEAPTDEGFDSVFIAADAHLTNPAKQLGGNVNKANKNFAAGTEKGGSNGRVFKITAIEKDEEFGVAGARIFRIK